MADTSFTYTGDNIQTTFNIPFPYLQESHVKVEINGFNMLNPAAWYFSGSSVVFRVPPGDGSSVKIYRQTGGSTRLVNFQNGAVLTEADLDLSADQNFYLVQEAKENFTDLINAEILRIGGGNGIVTTVPDEIIANLVDTILADATALNLSQRVQDIDDNASSILDVSTNLQSQVNALAQATAALVFVQIGEPVPGVAGVPDPIPDGARWYDSDDNNHPYIYDQGATTWLDLEDPRVGANASSITALSVRLDTEEGLSAAQATSISTLNATVYHGSLGVVANSNALISLNTEVDDNLATFVTEQSVTSTARGAIASDVALLGVANGADTAFILDTSTVKIDSDGGDTFATRLSALATTDGVNAANITTEQSARIAADIVTADELHLLGAQNGAANAFILNTATVKLDSDVGDTMATKFSSLVAADATNVASISTEQTARISADGVIAADITLMGARNGAQTAFILDTSTVKIDSDGGDTFATRLTALAAADGTNSASISTIQTVTIPGVQSDADAAQSTADTGVTNAATAQTAADAAQGDADTLMAKYGVSLNVNGYITGFAQNNDGTTGTFVILADKFAIVDPSGDPAETEFIPFSVSGGVVTMQNVVIAGNLFVGGSISGTDIGNLAIDNQHIADNAVTADEINVGNIAAISADLGAITAGSIVLDSSGFIRGGQTAYNTGTGFFLGYESSAYRFSIGDGGGNSLKWDGTTLVIRGNVSIGSYTASNNIMLSATTIRTTTGGYPTTQMKKAFSLNRTGTVRVTFDKKLASISGGLPNAGAWAIKLDGVTKASGTITTSSYSGVSQDITMGSGSSITIEITNGMRNTSEPVVTQASIQNAYIKADKSDGEVVTTD